jgi:hypothetical protein
MPANKRRPLLRWDVSLMRKHLATMNKTEVSTITVRNKDSKKLYS